jgi:hypothetical protein
LAVAKVGEDVEGNYAIGEYVAEAEYDVVGGYIMCEAV